MSWTYENWMETLKEVQKKASQDSAFRGRALADARAAVKEISGRDLPASFKIRFAEPGSEMVLPLAATAGEIGVRDLESVAGGAGQTAPWLTPHAPSESC